MNPYAKYLDGRPVAEILGATAGELRKRMAAIGAERWTLASAPGKWSAAEIVVHLADCEIAFGFRVRQLLAEENPTIQPFDQDKWMARARGLSCAAALESFAALRAWTLLLIAETLEQAAERTTTHPGRGVLCYREILETIAGHDLDHLEQLKRIAEAK